MRLLKKERSQRVFGITIGDSTIFIPEGFNPEEIFTYLVLDSTPGGVPINQIKLSLAKWLELTERFCEQLIKAGRPELARQILPRGGD